MNQLDLGKQTQQGGNQEISPNYSGNKEGSERTSKRSTKFCLWNQDVGSGPTYHQTGGTESKEIQRYLVALCQNL